MEFVSKCKAMMMSDFYRRNGKAKVRIGDVQHPNIGVNITEEEAKQVFKELGEFFDLEANLPEPEVVEPEKDLVAEMIIDEILLGLEESQRLTKADMIQIFELTDMEVSEDETASAMYKKLLDRIVKPVEVDEESKEVNSEETEVNAEETEVNEELTEENAEETEGV